MPEEDETTPTFPRLCPSCGSRLPEHVEICPTCWVSSGKIVPVDLSEYSHTTINRGKELAREFNATLEFLHVVESEAHPEFYNISFEPILKENPNLADHITENMIKANGIPKDQATYAVREGKVYKEIKKYADYSQIDLIIMGTHGRGDLEDFLLGSSSERVVRIASCPVLTVREKS